MRLTSTELITVLTAVTTLFFKSSLGFYLPGLAPNNYLEGNKVELNVNALEPISTSNKGKLQSVLPYDYYEERFHFCRPGKIEGKEENLGSALFGDRIFNSPFEIHMLKEEKCKLLCDPQKVPKKDAEFINSLIKENYGHDWTIDGLPVGYEKTDDFNTRSFYSIGFPLGNSRNQGVPNLHNHFEIFVEYHTTDKKNYRVVGATVTPKSIDHKVHGDQFECNSEQAKALSIENENEVYYTYSESDTPWRTRWDLYLKVSDSTIHWFSLINSSVIVLFLTGMVGMILIRALHKDISRYNQIDTQEDIQEDFGWKLVHGDVFRAPTNYMLLSVMAGSGVQLFLMCFVTLVFAVLGFLSPSMRGSLSTAMVFLFVLFASASGFTSARLYKMFGGESFKSNMLITALLFPGIVFMIFIILNFFLIGSGSSAAVPFGTMFSIIALWFLVSTPLSFAGSYYGLQRPRLAHPVRTNQIPRQIPDQPIHFRLIPSILLGGVLPFGAIFIELYYIMNSLWFHKLYYVFGFLFLVYIILILTCSEVAILLCYFHLCSENYRWWWRAFLTSGSTGLYVLLLSIIYYFTRLQLSFTSSLIYAGWALVTSLLCFLVTGSIGFLTCLLFVRKIYASIKID